MPTKPYKKYYIFRTDNAKQPIETGRLFNTPKENICKLCDCYLFVDELHYFFKCMYIKFNVYVLPNIYSMPNCKHCSMSQKNYQYL